MSKIKNMHNLMGGICIKSIGLILIFMSIICQTQSGYYYTCQTSNQCSSVCLNSKCTKVQYSTYRSYSVSYQSSSCCQGCNWGYFYYSSSNYCYKQWNNCEIDSQGYQLFWNFQTNTCNRTCTTGYRDYTTLKCTQNCTYGLLTDNINKQCTKQCPQGTFDSRDGNTICSATCNNLTLFPIADNINHLCVEINKCSFDQFNNQQTYSDNISSLCLNKCPQDTFAHPQTKNCVKQCWGNYSLPIKQLSRCVYNIESYKQDLEARLIQRFNKMPEQQEEWRQVMKSDKFIYCVLSMVLSLIVISFGCLGLCSLHFSIIKPKLMKQQKQRQEYKHKILLKKRMQIKQQVQDNFQPKINAKLDNPQA